MRKIIFISHITLLFWFVFSTKAFTLSINETENLADLTAVYIFLKHDCGYSQIPDREIERAIFYFAQSNHWDISNYDKSAMAKLNEERYDDLKKIPIPRKKKCRVLANDALALFAYVK